MSEAAQDILRALAAVLEARRGADPAQSYTASLFARGRAVIARKLGEEALETVIAALAEDRDALVRETADLWFHSLVLLADADLGPEAVLDELRRRFGVSGHAEKRARGEPPAAGGV